VIGSTAAPACTRTRLDRRRRIQVSRRAGRCVTPLVIGVIGSLFVPQSALGEELAVEVHGARIPTPPKDPSIAGNVIARERLEAPGTTASDVLRTQPGVAVVESGGFGGFSTAALRGATAAQTPVYLAGVRLNDDVAGAADLSLIPLWLLHRVEIYRSNAPIEADVLGIGGAIFFEPRRPREPSASVGAMAGSFGARGLWGSAGLGNERGAALVGVRVDGARNDYSFLDDRGTRFDDGDDRRVTRVNADSRTVDVWAIGSVALGSRGRLDLVFNAADRAQGLPGLSLFPSAEARAQNRRQLGALTARLSCGGPSCEISATTSLLLAHARWDDPLAELALGTTRIDLTGARVEESVRASFFVAPTVKLVPSALVAVESLGIDTLAAPGLRAHQLNARVALSSVWSPLGILNARATAAAQCTGTGVSGLPPWALAGDAAGAPASPSPCADAEPSLRLGVDVGRPWLLGLANVGRYARIPTLGERFGVSGPVRGNATLAPEHGLSADAGVRASIEAGPLRGLSVEAFGFARFASDLVAYQRSSLGYVRPFNVGSARVVGAELLAVYRPFHFLQIEQAATFLDPRNTSPKRTTRNDLLPYQARLVLASRVSLQAKPRWGSLSTAKLSAAYFHASSRYADAAGLIVLPPQGSLDLEGELGLHDDHLAIRVRVSNALDQIRADLIGYPLPGRAFYTSMESRW
jgi:vitamin B12 transporter